MDFPLRSEDCTLPQSAGPEDWRAFDFERFDEWYHHPGRIDCLVSMKDDWRPHNYDVGVDGFRHHSDFGWAVPDFLYFVTPK